MMGKMMWMQRFLETHGYSVEAMMILQGNQGMMLLYKWDMVEHEADQMTSYSVLLHP